MNARQWLMAGMLVVAVGARGASLELPGFGSVQMIDTVDCTKTDHDFLEYPAGASQVVTVLGKKCRELKPVKGEGSFFKYRLGKGKKLKGQGAYVVVIEYPEDAPRNYTIYNQACAMRRSFATGICVGDAYNSRIVDNHPESLDYPLSGAWEKWTAFSTVYDHTTGFTAAGEQKRLNTKDNDGFDIALCNYPIEHGPASHGVCAARLHLCAVPDEKKLALKITYPVKNLPRRRLFWREEMSDNEAIQDNPACDDRLDWFRWHARQMKFLGINTFCKEMLEFGHNQHWDADWLAGKPGGKPRNWMWGSKHNVWEETVKLMADYGFDILPYYEYGGANGGNVGVGPKKKAEPLGAPGVKDYTHIWWSEKLRADITDPETQEEFKYILDGTVLRFKEQLPRFAGIWIRPRPAQMAVGFGDATRERFAKEANGGKSVSREQLKKDRALYNRYIDWWGKKRADWCEMMRDHLAKGGVKQPIVLLTGDTNEPGRAPQGGAFACENPKAWTALCAKNGVKAPGKYTTSQQIAASHAYLAAAKAPAGTWGKWEWQHAVPGDDPAHYAALKDVWITTAFNRLYTVLDDKLFDDYSNANGTVSMIRHYSLNENMLWFKNAKDGGKEKPLLGYAVSDVERAGRACMESEVTAMAHGDPVNIGYLMGYNFGRGFPAAVREFDANFLALPALPSKIVPGASADPEVVLREIDCSKFVPGKKYYALVHTGRTPKKSVAVKFPGAPAELKFPGVGRTVKTKGGTVTLNLKPWQLLAVER